MHSPISIRIVIYLLYCMESASFAVLFGMSKAQGTQHGAEEHDLWGSYLRRKQGDAR